VNKGLREGREWFSPHPANPPDWDEEHTFLPAAETLKLLSGNPVMHDGRKPLSPVPETFVHLLFLILIQWGAVSLRTHTYAV
jgi:hypothetical protein